MNLRQFIIICIWPAVFAGCKSRRIEVATEPMAADVLIFDTVNNSYRSIGQTPVDLRENTIASDVISNSNVIALSIEKQGYVIERVFIDKNQPADVSLKIKLKKITQWVESEKKTTYDREVDQVLREVQGIISTSKKQDYVLAHANIINLISRFPEAALLWEIKGSIERLRNQNAEAIKSYRKSLSLGSNDPEIIEAIRKMEETP